jgi:hypothetical protein
MPAVLQKYQDKEHCGCLYLRHVLATIACFKPYQNACMKGMTASHKLQSDSEAT